VKPPSRKLLATADMADFVARGVLVLEGVVSESVNQQAIAEIHRIRHDSRSLDRPERPLPGGNWRTSYPESSGLRSVLLTPQVAAAILSLVGPSATFDHDSPHIRAAKTLEGQPLHADAVIDNNTAFDIQLLYFPQAVGPTDGGTKYIPGSHLRAIHETEVARYQHLVGETTWTGPAGSVLVMHHGLWHCATPNRGDAERLMFKVRLSPAEPQVRLWDQTDLLTGTYSRESLDRTLWTPEPWMGQADHRLDHIARVRLWRYVSGDPNYDTSSRLLARLESKAHLNPNGEVG